MAKKKSRSSSKKKEPTYLAELYGLLLILIAILGICKYGPVGRLISGFSLFLVGNLYVVLLIIVLVVGVYTIMSRKSVNLLSSKMIKSLSLSSSKI